MGKRTNKYEIVEIDKLIPYANNARTHSDEQIKKIQASIREFGFINPVLIDKDCGIIAGHGRVEAAKREGMTKVPCVWVEHLTETQKKAYMLADNRLALDAGWDMDVLKVELEGLQDINFDIDLTGFNSKELSDIFGEEELEVVEDDFNGELPEVPKTKLGDIYQLGRHRLLCGDSFSSADVDKLMDGVKADFGFCDPPYDMDNDGWVSNLSYIKQGNPIFLMASDKQTVRLANIIPNFRHFIIHDRVSAVMLNSNMPMSRHTIISFFCEHPGKHFVNLRDYFTTIIEVNKNYKDSNEENFSKMGKPVQISAELIRHYSKKNDIVLDLFGGGGSTLIACEQLDRVCYMNELDPASCDVIVQRWENLTGKKAILK